MTNEELIVKVTEHETKIKSAEHRLSDLEEKTDKIESLTLSVQKLALSVERMTEEQQEYRNEQRSIVQRLIQIENQPSKDKALTYDKVVSTIITVVTSALVGGILAYFGLH